MNERQQLELRIAAALTGPTSSAELGELITEIEATIPAAQAAIVEARARLLDPRKTADARTRQALSDAIIAADRLAASVAPLQQRAVAVFRAEEIAAHKPKYERLLAERDALAQRLQSLYEPFASAIVPLLAAIEQLDVRVREMNASAPNDAPYLKSTEEHARGVTAHDLLICRDLKLPGLERQCAARVAAKQKRQRKPDRADGGGRSARLRS